MKYNSIDASLFIHNRKKFTAHLLPGAIAIFNSNDIYPTNGDGTIPFIQNSDMFWLSGVDQEESILILFPDAKREAHREMLFVKETSELIAIWEGAKLTKEQATATSGVPTVYWLDQLEMVLKEIMQDAKAVYLNSNEHTRRSTPVQTRDDRFRDWIKAEYPLHRYERSSPILHEVRSTKHELEIAVMQEACNITEKGLRRILPFIKPGVMEYEIEAELIGEFVRNRSRGFAYTPIIASGGNACVLHYIENNKECKDGDLILMDFGAEYGNYASDLTRTVPVNGRFTDRQRDVYNAVLRVMKAATSMLRPGTILNEYNKEVGKIMEAELLQLGLLSEQEIKDQDPANPAFRKYFMHGTSHFIGIEVHDVGFFNRPIDKGMCFTVEPGIYIREEGIGVRIENDVVVTDGEPHDLMANIPREVEEIEELMNAGVPA